MHLGPGDEVAQVYRDAWWPRSGNTRTCTSATPSARALSPSTAASAGTSRRRATSRASPRRTPMFPNLLPAVSYDGSGPTITWNDISPRVSATFALDDGEKDHGPRVVRAVRRSAESRASDLRQPGRRLLQLHRLQMERPEQRPLRAEERGAHEPGPALLLRHRPGIRARRSRRRRASRRTTTRTTTTSSSSASIAS